MTGRIQLALNHDDLGESIVFYSKLFDTEPAKVRPGYANFAVAEPLLKLVLLENPGQGGSLNHLGVEVADTGVVEAEQARLARAGLAAVEERDTTCCYARQDHGPGAGSRPAWRGSRVRPRVLLIAGAQAAIPPAT